MKMVKTKFHGPTMSNSARISAENDEGKRIYCIYDDGLSIDENHKRTAMKLVFQMIGKETELYKGIFNHEFYWLIKRD